MAASSYYSRGAELGHYGETGRRWAREDVERFRARTGEMPGGDGVANCCRWGNVYLDFCYAEEWERLTGEWPEKTHGPKPTPLTCSHLSGDFGGSKCPICRADAPECFE